MLLLVSSSIFVFWGSYKLWETWVTAGSRLNAAEHHMSMLEQVTEGLQQEYEGLEGTVWKLKSLQNGINPTMRDEMKKANAQIKATVAQATQEQSAPAKPPAAPAKPPAPPEALRKGRAAVAKHKAAAIFSVRGGSGGFGDDHGGHDANGPYIENGQYNGKPQYKNLNGCVIRLATASNGDFASLELAASQTVWALICKESDRYFVRASNDGRPPENGWSGREGHSEGSISITRHPETS